MKFISLKKITKNSTENGQKDERFIFVSAEKVQIENV